MYYILKYNLSGQVTESINALGYLLFYNQTDWVEIPILTDHRTVRNH